MKKPRVVLMSARSMKWCRDNGWESWRAEATIPSGKRAHATSRDLMGWMDVLAFEPICYGVGVWVGIQACAMCDRTKHLRKFQDNPKTVANILRWAATEHHRAELWAWRLLKVKRGGKAVLWTHQVTDLAEAMRQPRSQPSA